jgi:hypothetical protein
MHFCQVYKCDFLPRSICSIALALDAACAWLADRRVGDCETSPDPISFRADARRAAIRRSRTIFTSSIWSLKNKGFCDPVISSLCYPLLRLAVATSLTSLRLVGPDRASAMSGSSTAAALRVRFADRFEDGCCHEAVATAVRFGAARGERGAKPARRGLTQRSARRIELIENSVREQRLAEKMQSRLRAICATPFQKRLFGYGSERFLYCVCRSLR